MLHHRTRNVLEYTFKISSVNTFHVLQRSHYVSGEGRSICGYPYLKCYSTSETCSYRQSIFPSCLLQLNLKMYWKALINSDVMCTFVLLAHQNTPLSCKVFRIQLATSKAITKLLPEDPVMLSKAHKYQSVWFKFCSLMFNWVVLGLFW